MGSVDGKSFSHSLNTFLGGLFLQFVLAVVGSMLIGFLPEAFISRYYYNSGFEAYSPAIFATAIMLGYLVTRSLGHSSAIMRKLGHSSAMWVWIVGLVWLVYGAYDESSQWYKGVAHSRLDYIVANFFGPTSKCSETECLNELFFTTPFTATIGYSLGAAIGLAFLPKHPADQNEY
jgi:hypothetical protein